MKYMIYAGIMSESVPPGVIKRPNFIVPILKLEFSAEEMTPEREKLTLAHLKYIRENFNCTFDYQKVSDGTAFILFCLVEFIRTQGGKDIFAPIPLNDLSESIIRLIIAEDESASLSKVNEIRTKYKEHIECSRRIYSWESGTFLSYDEVVKLKQYKEHLNSSFLQTSVAKKPQNLEVQFNGDYSKWVACNFFYYNPTDQGKYIVEEERQQSSQSSDIAEALRGLIVEPQERSMEESRSHYRSLGFGF